MSPIADTTTTRSLPAARSRAIRRATRLMRSASATDEPPNFWTTRGAYCRVIGRRILPCGSARPGTFGRSGAVASRRFVERRCVRRTIWRTHGRFLGRYEPPPAAGERPMCFDLDSRPPIAPIAGGALDGTSLVLTADDGNRFLAFRARASEPSGAGIVDPPRCPRPPPVLRGARAAVRGGGHRCRGVRLLRAERRASTRRATTRSSTSRTSRRRPGRASPPTCARPSPRSRADGDRVGSLFTIGFCMGGRAAFVTPTLGLGLAGAIGFYGSPTAARANIPPIPAEIAPEMEGARARPVRRRRHGHPGRPTSRRSTRRSPTPASTTGSSPTTAPRTASSTARPPTSPTRARPRGPRCSVHPGSNG